MSSYKVLSSGEVLLLFADEKRLFFFLAREREPLARLQIKKILSIPSVQAHLSKCPHPEFLEPAL